jgi:hypothetical protein
MALAVPGSAYAGSRASSDGHHFKGSSKYSDYRGRHDDDRHHPYGRSKHKKKFPPGLVDKCFGDDDHPGKHGHKRACKYRSHGAG